MVLQVAASGNVKECYGIEKAEIPAKYAEVDTGCYYYFFFYRDILKARNSCKIGQCFSITRVWRPYMHMRMCVPWKSKKYIYL